VEDVRGWWVGVQTKHGPDKLKHHKAATHSIDIVWHYCPELGCEYRAMQKCEIKVHWALAHNIGGVRGWWLCLQDKA